MGIVDREERLAAHLERDVLGPACLLVAGLAHVGNRDCLELLDRQPRGQLGQEALERRPAERPKRPIFEGHEDVQVVRGKLEIDRSGCLAGGAVLRPLLDVEPDE